MRTAIFPGSFDPVHNAHIAIARAAADKIGIERVIFVPSGVSPNKRHKQRTPGTTRHEWLRKALAELGDPRLCVSDHESRHNIPTYTLETLQALLAAVPKEDRFLLVGTDTAERMKRWPSYQKVLATAQVVAFGRSGSPGTIEAPEWDHASSEIRKLIAAGRPIDGLVPPAIAGEITEHFKVHPCPQLTSPQLTKALQALLPE